MGAQTDVKSALAYASLAQVGIIVVEISFGLTTIAFVHIFGHVCFRLLQFLSAPNILHDLQALEPMVPHKAHTRSPRLTWLYFVALEQGFLDRFVDAFIVKPLTTMLRWFDNLDRLLCANRTDGKTREEDCR